MINKLALYCLLLVVISTNSLAQKKLPVASKPNIIFILADDLGIGNVSCYGADNYKTPQIDALAKNGIRFSHAYTAPLCGPSRALILTGRYAFRTGATNQDQTGEMKPSVEVMMPSILKSAGYVTGSFGKWGQLPLGPAEFGFDAYLRFKGSGVYWKAGPKSEDYEVNGVHHTLKEGEYMPDLMHEEMKQFIIQHKKEPFYIYYPMSHVHGQIVPTPDSKPDIKDLYADNIAYMDKLVGKLVLLLDSLQLRERTLILFFGDNGTAGEYAKTSTIGGKALMGKKGNMLECGSLVPLIANWKGVTPKGIVANQLIDASDFVPTLAAIAGAKIPEGLVLDGKSFAGKLKGQATVERDWIFMQLASNWYVRNKRWKLNETGDLFDMYNAPFEEKKVAADTKDTAVIAAKTYLSKILANLNPAGGIADKGDGTGRHANKALKKAKKMTEKEGAAPTDSIATATIAKEKREAKFNKMDAGKTGRIDRATFIQLGQNAEKAAKQFDKMDKNHDGVLTKEEFMGE